MRSENRNLEVAVVGGSLVGPATELLLRRAGFENVTTYEAMPAAVSQSGGVMGLRWSTLDILKQLGVAAADVQALESSVVHAWDLRADGSVVRRGVSEFPGVVSSWDRLHHKLRQLVTVRAGWRLTAARADAGRWHLRFGGGSNGVRTAEADFVVFADGRKSFGRELLDSDRELVYNGYVTWRGLGKTPHPTPQGFERFYDGSRGRLFAVTEPIMRSGHSYWELSHNLPSQIYAELAGDLPTRCAYILPQRIGEHARATIATAALGLSDEFQRMINNSMVSCIPVNDVPLPTTVVHRRSGATAALLGDAIVPVRLQVGAGLNLGLHQAHDLVDALAARDRDVQLNGWSARTLNRLGPVVELGRSRAHRVNLGRYVPVQPGRTAVPVADQWSEPGWVTA